MLNFGLSEHRSICQILYLMSSELRSALDLIYRKLTHIAKIMLKCKTRNVIKTRVSAPIHNTFFSALSDSLIELCLINSYKNSNNIILQ